MQINCTVEELKEIIKEIKNTSVAGTTDVNKIIDSIADRLSDVYQNSEITICDTQKEVAKED